MEAVVPSPWREQGANRSFLRYSLSKIHRGGGGDPGIIQGLQQQGGRHRIAGGHQMLQG